jgi:hypothetical protein
MLGTTAHNQVEKCHTEWKKRDSMQVAASGTNEEFTELDELCGEWDDLISEAASEAAEKKAQKTKKEEEDAARGELMRNAAMQIKAGEKPDSERGNSDDDQKASASGSNRRRKRADEMYVDYLDKKLRLSDYQAVAQMSLEEKRLALDKEKLDLERERFAVEREERLAVIEANKLQLELLMRLVNKGN